jgi:hypothetical protein
MKLKTLNDAFRHQLKEDCLLAENQIDEVRSTMFRTAASHNFQATHLKKITQNLFLGLLCLVTLIITFSAPTDRASAQSNALTVPSQDDWVDHGLIFSKGANGQWDNILWGGFAGCVTKKDGLFYLYYQGSDGYDNVEDTVTHRAIGLATSNDGLNFQKYANNPIITYSPSNNIEEGAVSCGVSLEGGEIVMYYGANKSLRSNSSSVNANGMVTTSADGYNFTDQGVALNYADPTLWASGDEVFPVMSLKAPETNQWIVYYIPNGVSQSGLLGAAWGNSMLDLTNSAGVKDPAGNNITTWGMGGGVVSLQNGTYAVFTNNVSTKTMEARLMNPNNPDALSAPVQTYNFADFSAGVVYFDSSSNTWYLFYRNDNASAYGVKTAVVNQTDNQPPTVSAGQDATVSLQNGSATVALTGTASDDGLPNPPGALTYNWHLVSGPRGSTIANPSSLSTTATLKNAGTYIFELSVSDSELTATDTITITVQSAASAQPSCTLNDANWNRSSARNGQRTNLKVLASGCTGGEVILFDIYEVVEGSPSAIVVEAQTTTMAANNQARLDWIANYNCDDSGINCPAPGDTAVYYFVAYAAASPNDTITSPLLSVDP